MCDAGRALRHPVPHRLAMSSPGAGEVPREGMARSGRGPRGRDSTREIRRGLRASQGPPPWTARHTPPQPRNRTRPSGPAPRSRGGCRRLAVADERFEGVRGEDEDAAFVTARQHQPGGQAVTQLRRQDEAALFVESRGVRTEERRHGSPPLRGDRRGGGPRPYDVPDDSGAPLPRRIGPDSHGGETLPMPARQVVPLPCSPRYSTSLHNRCFNASGDGIFRQSCSSTQGSRVEGIWTSRGRRVAFRGVPCDVPRKPADPDCAVSHAKKGPDLRTRAKPSGRCRISARSTPPGQATSGGMWRGWELLGAVRKR